jgi:5-methylcytosine-specific restriction endonuclease McrA
MREYFQRKGGNPHRPSPEQAAAYYRKRKAEGKVGTWTPSRQEASHRRRARKQGATVEKFRHADIFERDGWICGICEDAVDPELAYPHPMSVSLDHVIPLSLGGEHSRANVRCTHLSCNVKRGARAA